MLVKIYHGLVFTVDAEHGLRAWNPKQDPQLLATICLARKESTDLLPTSLGINTIAPSSPSLAVSVGLQDGSFRIYDFELPIRIFSFRYAHPASSTGALSAITLALPYVLTMAHNKTLSLYNFPEPSNRGHKGLRDPPRLLASLKSEAAFAPLSLSIRLMPNGIVACIAYAFSPLNLGWAVGLQEIRMTVTGETISSRLSSGSDLAGSNFQSIKDQDATISARATTSEPFALHPQSMARPSSLSYSHPYLLASLPDNTLMIYLVKSDADDFSITAGRRLWGHTSSVSGAEVSSRGKAVSASTKGNEIRIWELEDVVTSSTNRRPSIRLTPEKQDLTSVVRAIARRGSGLGISFQDMQQELAFTRSWIGFDDEQVIVLGGDRTRQVLSCYDFT